MRVPRSSPPIGLSSFHFLIFAARALCRVQIGHRIPAFAANVIGCSAGFHLIKVARRRRKEFVVLGFRRTRPIETLCGIIVPILSRLADEPRIHGVTLISLALAG